MREIEVIKEDFILFWVYAEDRIVLLMYINVSGESVRIVGKIQSQ